jgi:hypothetical protein
VTDPPRPLVLPAADRRLPVPRVIRTTERPFMIAKTFGTPQGLKPFVIMKVSFHLP